MTAQEIRDIIGFDACDGAEELIEKAVCLWINSLEYTGWDKYIDADVHMTGSIWVENPDSGRWLSDSEIIEFWAWHEAQTDDPV